MFCFLLYTVLFAGIAYAVWQYVLKDSGQPHSRYFANLQAELKSNGQGHPVIVVDLDRLDQNIDHAKSYFHPNTSIRIPAKSLPCAQLINHICERADTQNLMVFHRPFLSLLLKTQPKTRQFLLGKPMPVQALNAFFNTLPNSVKKTDACARTQWLIDSIERAEQYLAVAQANNVKLRFNIEIDIGMHRGGVPSPHALDPICRLISDNPKHLEFAGFMGYEAHIAKTPITTLPRIEKERQKCMALYNEFKNHVKHNFPEQYRDDLTFNGSGTQTYQMYSNDTTINDICLASSLVKPTDFDLITVQKQEPAIFIATPVIKSMKGLSLPFITNISQKISRFVPNWQQTVFTYGGYWKAEPHSPQGLKNNSLYGRSSNQEILTISERAALKQDDYVFLRPTQSEAVMLEFNHLVIVKGGKIVDHWSNFNQDLLTQKIQ